MLSNIFYWLACVTSVISLFALLAIFILEGMNLPRLTRRECLLFVFFPVGVAAGLILAWIRPFSGGLLALASLSGFYAAHYASAHEWPRGTAFLAFTAPAILFLLSGILA